MKEIRLSFLLYNNCCNENFHQNQKDMLHSQTIPSPDNQKIIKSVEQKPI